MNEIETMAQVMAGCEKTCDECFAEYEKLFTQPIQNRGKHCQAIEYCTKLHNAGYKNCKDKVVLSKEVFNKNYVLIDELLLKQELAETLKKVASAQEKTIKLLREELAKAKKETARGIINKVDDMIGGKMIAQALREIYEVE